MADEAALIRAEEEARVAPWCRQQGVANEMDLAFFYLTFDEALRNAGRAVANAWQQARNRSSVGLAVTARPVMALGVPFSAPKPSASPRLRSRPEPVVITSHLAPSSYEASSSSDTVGENQLLAIMLACSSHRPSTANERDAMRAFVLDVVGRTEQVTLRNALSTWHELRSFASGCKVELNALTALQLAAFMRAHKAPTRAYNALFWMNKKLKLGYDTSLLIKPAKKSAPTKFGGQTGSCHPPSGNHCPRDVFGGRSPASQVDYLVRCPLHDLRCGSFRPHPEIRGPLR